MNKIILFFLLTAGVGVTPVSAESFHGGGVGGCEGCHVIHKSSSSSMQLLLQAADPSSICLNCHAGVGGANSPSVFSPDGSALTPGGDFYWLTKNFSWLGGQSPGNSHGHNVVALDYNLLPDPVNQVAPGGTYPAARLGCTSCHDPHGQVGGGSKAGGQAISGSGSYGDIAAAGTTKGNYRLLGDTGYNGGGSTWSYSFANNAPTARQSSVMRYGESDSSHVDYGTGMSEWCGNCHAAILNNNHQAGASSFSHPAGNSAKLPQNIIDMYNSYLRTGDFSGTNLTAYLQFVPFERGVANPELLDPHSSKGPDGAANVMCLTCHRAHASAFEHSGRWDFKAQLLAQSHPALGDSGATASDISARYYGRDIASAFGGSQGQFCEKCHGPENP